MDFKELEKSFDEFSKNADEYFKSLSTIGIIGWGLAVLGFILLIVALFI